MRFTQVVKNWRMKMFRKITFALLSCMLLSFSAGCRAQQITPVPIITAPAVTSTAFVQLNLSAPVTVLTYTDQPATGSFCYFVQMLDGSGVSAASNVSCNTTTSTLKHSVLTWNAPAGYTCQNSPCGYVVSRAPAILNPVGIPVQLPSTQAAQLEDPNKITLQLAMR